MESSTVTRRRIHPDSTMDRPKQDSPDSQITPHMVMVRDTLGRVVQATTVPLAPPTTPSSPRRKVALLVNQGTVINLPSMQCRSLEMLRIQVNIPQVCPPSRSPRTLLAQIMSMSGLLQEETNMYQEINSHHPGIRGT